MTRAPLKIKIDILRLTTAREEKKFCQDYDGLSQLLFRNAVDRDADLLYRSPSRQPASSRLLLTGKNISGYLCLLNCFLCAHLFVDKRVYLTRVG